MSKILIVALLLFPIVAVASFAGSVISVSGWMVVPNPRSSDNTRPVKSLDDHKTEIGRAPEGTACGNSTREGQTGSMQWRAWGKGEAYCVEAEAPMPSSDANFTWFASPLLFDDKTWPTVPVFSLRVTPLAKIPSHVIVGEAFVGDACGPPSRPLEPGIQAWRAWPASGPVKGEVFCKSLPAKSPRPPVPAFVVEWFNDATLTAKAYTSTETTINHDWQKTTPPGLTTADAFSARWSTMLTPLASGDYTFTTNSDDGVRVFLDGEKIIDNWTRHGPTENRVTKTLEGGKRYALKVEYFEGGGGAVMQLFWSDATHKQAPLNPATFGR